MAAAAGMAAWRRQQLLAYLPLAAADCLEPVSHIGRRVLEDMVISVEGLAEELHAPHLPGVLSTPLPYDSANPAKPAVMAELMPPTRPSLLAATWDIVKTTFAATPQSTPIVLVTGVSGMGKTKVAYDIGRQHAFLIVSRVVECDVITAPWQAFEAFALAVLSSGRHDSELPPLHERVSILSSMMVLLGAHMEYALDVTDAVLSDACSSHLAAAIAHEAASQPAGASPLLVREAVLRNAVLRAQRNALAYAHVAHLFTQRMHALLAADGVIAADGGVHLTQAHAVAYVRSQRDRALAVWGRRNTVTGRQVMPDIVFAHDEAHALLPVSKFPIDLFLGTFTAPTAAVGAAAPAAGAAAAPTRGRYGLFYGLLATIRGMVGCINAAHLLLGSSWDMSSEMLASYSPAQGKSATVDLAINFNADDVTQYLQRYLTPEAMGGVTPELAQQLQGRPLFSSLFWVALVAQCRESAAPVTPAEAVRAALQAAYSNAQAAARDRIESVWDRDSPSLRGIVPSQLMARLVHVLIMEGRITDGEWGSLLPQLQVAVQRGIFNAPMAAGSRIDPRVEPATHTALLQAGLRRIRDDTDGIMQLLASRMTGPAGGTAGDQGSALDDCFAWALVRRCLRHDGPMTLGELLQPFFATSVSTATGAAGALDPLLVPPACAILQVRLTCGRRADGPDWAARCPLSLLASEPSAVVHHTTDRMGGADWMFAAHAPDGTIVPVLLHGKNRETGTFLKALESLDMGRWYNAGATELEAHRDMRRVLADHPGWTCPVRVIVGARPFDDGLVRDVAWLNQLPAVSAYPLLLLQATIANTDAAIFPSHDVLGPYCRPTGRNWPHAFVPSRIRFWPEAPVPPLPPMLTGAVTSLRVELRSAAGHAALEAAVDAAANNRHAVYTRKRTFWLRPAAVIATFTQAVDAFTVVRAFQDGATIAGSAVTVSFA